VSLRSSSLSLVRSAKITGVRDLEAAMNSYAEVQTRIQLLLMRLPFHELKGLLVLLESLVQQEERDSTSEVLDNVEDVRYDFSDLVGRLSWRGDAIAVQRKLRDEW
jgi:hypothetical protein